MDLHLLWLWSYCPCPPNPSFLVALIFREHIVDDALAPSPKHLGSRRTGSSLLYWQIAWHMVASTLWIPEKAIAGLKTCTREKDVRYVSHWGAGGRPAGLARDKLGVGEYVPYGQPWALGIMDWGMGHKRVTWARPMLQLDQSLHSLLSQVLLLRGHCCTPWGRKENVGTW